TYCSIIGVAAGWAVSRLIGVSSFTCCFRLRQNPLPPPCWRFTVAKCSLNPERSTKTKLLPTDSIPWEGIFRMAKKPENAGPSVSAEEALHFHAMGRPGKLEVVPTKPMATQRDLSLAYSPGVAVPVKAIAEEPSRAFDYTTKGNMVAVISNGTAILGLGNLD